MYDYFPATQQLFAMHCPCMCSSHTTSMHSDPPQEYTTQPSESIVCVHVGDAHFVARTSSWIDDEWTPFAVVLFVYVNKVHTMLV